MTKSHPLIPATICLSFLLLALVSCTPKGPVFDEAVERLAILELHEEQRLVHLQKRGADFVGLLSSDHISVNRGEVSHPTEEELATRFQAYFDAVEFVEWDDVKEPIIRFSQDGSMAYTIVEKEVTVHYPWEGELVQVSTPFAWTAIYEKRDDNWTIATVTSTNQEDVTKELSNITSIADCISPQGAYTTEMHSTPDGYLYFQQTFGEAGEGFYAVALNDSVGYELTEEGSRVRPLSIEVIQMLKGHNFFWHYLTPAQCFNDIQRSDDHTRATATDFLGNPVSLYYDSLNFRLRALQLQNSLNVSEDIEIDFASFTETEFGPLPRQVTIVQNHQDTFHFQFSDIRINDPDFAQKTN